VNELASTSVRKGGREGGREGREGGGGEMWYVLCHDFLHLMHGLLPRAILGAAAGRGEGGREGGRKEGNGHQLSTPVAVGHGILVGRREGGRKGNEGM